MSDCPLVRHVENLKLLKKFEQTGLVTIPISQWIRFFEALALLAHGGAHREIYCVVGVEYVLFSKRPIERVVKQTPTQRELFE
jgi:hypothetical protein